MDFQDFLQHVFSFPVVYLHYFFCKIDGFSANHCLDLLIILLKVQVPFLKNENCHYLLIPTLLFFLKNDFGKAFWNNMNVTIGIFMRTFPFRFDGKTSCTSGQIRLCKYWRSVTPVKTVTFRNLREKLQRFVSYFYFPCGEKVLVTLTHDTVFSSHPVVSLAHHWFKSLSRSGLEIYCINIFHKTEF